MALKLKTLLIFENVFTDAYVTVKPTITIKSQKPILNKDKEEEMVKIFNQRYNVEVKSKQGDFNYEASIEEFDIEKPTFKQCYEHLKNQPEFKDSTDA